jgi:hypothetical protein
LGDASGEKFWVKNEYFKVFSGLKCESRSGLAFTGESVGPAIFNAKTPTTW